MISDIILQSHIENSKSITRLTDLNNRLYTEKSQLTIENNILRDTIKNIFEIKKDQVVLKNDRINKSNLHIIKTILEGRTIL